MSKNKEIARAATADAIETIKSAHETATASLRESVTNLQASNDELREKAPPRGRLLTFGVRPEPTGALRGAVPPGEST